MKVEPIFKENYDRNNVGGLFNSSVNRFIVVVIDFKENVLIVCSREFSRHYSTKLLRVVINTSYN
jgi:hypothetical protein